MLVKTKKTHLQGFCDPYGTWTQDPPDEKSGCPTILTNKKSPRFREGFSGSVGTRTQDPPDEKSGCSTNWATKP